MLPQKEDVRGRRGLYRGRLPFSLEEIGELEASTQGPPNLGHIRLSHGGPSKRKVYLYNIVFLILLTAIPFVLEKGN